MAQPIVVPSVETCVIVVDALEIMCMYSNVFDVEAHACSSNWHLQQVLHPQGLAPISKSLRRASRPKNPPFAIPDSDLAIDSRI
jgi:hypothetical protein